jgi:hypothetical protein
MPLAILEIAQCCVKTCEIFMPFLAGQALRTMEEAFATEQHHRSFPRVRGEERAALRHRPIIVSVDATIICTRGGGL